MPAQPPAGARNYIDIVSDTTQEQRALEQAARSGARMKDYLRSLMSALLKRGKAA